ncbi:MULTISPECIES: multidrug efflux RND transporter permease subunit [unclassified Bradyrhizobium]|uniref:multidrug efflux RND transporter permease subunit n=1 Tax=unclassified Bradyrhizobium TaxID=2631580 RepID=UPI0024790191|nr:MULTISPECIES: multidrug efflux RND transporter permease subunit [unclassified Bradyrhizobium]WGR72329.1 multidrug efflux RND transporter permease subunit [Bradyrhizobium sp. ISRA426]WGR77163.1 multidrug efflux RND transporter permease subunit [Bradyrhizobium sp. ISRA430]WGR87568.1 multidrug efflux RND transporter permease subunit [Bradyrhizobium sp. ISRA432]
MQESFSSLFIRYPIGTSLLMAGILFVGLVAYPLLPVAPLPQVDFPTIQVSASLPGGSPETMASSVAQPLERQLAQIPGITQMTSTSSLGSASITIQFDLNRLIDAAANDVQAAINAASGQLPKNLPSPPTYRKVNPADSPIMILSATSDALPLTTVSDRTDAQLAQQISQLPGVAQVFVGGQQKPSVRIQVDPAKLVAKGLSLEDVRGQIATATSDSPKGNIDGQRRAYTIYANDQLLEAAHWMDVIVAYRNGAPLRIRDIGAAVAGPEDMKTAAWADGQRGVFLVIFKQPGANVIETVDRIKAQLPRLIAAIPPAIKIKIISDRTITIRAAVEDVQITLMITIALVVMVIFIFLRSFWATIIPSITVPLALLGACSLMWVFGYSLDNLSLMALTIAVGFVVDDAIVMLENITRYVERGERPLAAAYKGAAEIGFTIVSISISLIAVLIPLLLMGGIIGRLFREFAVTLSMAIFVSLVVSLTLTPMMASRFLRADQEARHGRFYQWSERMFERLLGSYERGLDLALRHSFVTLLIFFATVALSAGLFILIPKGFFPQQDNGFLTAVSEMPQDISFTEMKRRQEELNAIVQADPAVESIAMFIGGGGTALNSGRMYITLKPIAERDANAQAIIARLRPKLAEVEGARLYMQASQDVRLGGRATRTQFEFTLQDANLAELNEWAPKILASMKSLPQLRDVATDQQTEGTTLQLTINRDTASRYGIQPQLIDDTLYDAFGQRQVAQYFTQTNSYHVILEITPDLQGKLDTLDKVYIKSPLTGEQVPLSVICTWTNEPVRPLAIAHQGQFPAVTISFNLAEGVALGQATDAVLRAVGDMGAPPTLATAFQGTAQAFQQSLSSVPMLILAALVVVYLVLGVLYESYIHPLTILSTLPSAGVGAIAILMIFGFDFSLIALIGIILLIGIVKKNGIMMVDFAIAAEREQHLTPEQSIRQAALLRFRPIMMTTMAALLGGVPLMLGSGTGAEIRQPLGYAMVGGLLVSQALTLFTTPVVYLYLDRFSNLLLRWMEKKPEVKVEREERKDAAE